MGGPDVGFLCLRGEADIAEYVRALIEKMKPVTRHFVMREGNNLPPEVSLDKVLTMYETVVKYGKYES